MEKFEHYFAEKPMENTEDEFGIYDVTIYRAIKNKVPLMIHYQGKTAVHDPKIWIKTGKPIFRIYQRPDEPMRLFVNTAIWEKPLGELSQQEMFSKGYLS